MKVLEIFCVVLIAVFLLSACSDTATLKSGKHIKTNDFNTIAGDTVYFDYDDASLTEETKKKLNEQIRWLQSSYEVKANLEGHCDERGTEEYNIALGERRASKVKEYMTAHNVDSKRLDVISYGKSKPIDLAHTEAAWQHNRRVQTIIKDYNK